MDQPASNAVLVTEMALWANRTLGHLILAGVFERHPSLRFVPLDKSTPLYQLCAAWRKDNASPALERFLATARDVLYGVARLQHEVSRNGDRDRRERHERTAFSQSWRIALRPNDAVCGEHAAAEDVEKRRQLAHEDLVLQAAGG